jgi:uncharacterized protein YndB with AHSA1/START domain
MWFDVESVDLGFTETSPFKLENQAIIHASPERIFEIFVTGEGQREWFQDFRDARWTSSAPHGVGSTREIELALLTVKERFLAWEPGKRLTFAITAITIPIVTAMVEDMQLSRLDEKRTRLTWRVHYRPAFAFRLVHPVARSIFGRMFSAGAAGLTKYAGTHASTSRSDLHP